MSFLNHNDFSEPTRSLSREDLWDFLGYTKRQKMALRKVRAGIAFFDALHGVGNWEQAIANAIREDYFHVGCGCNCALALTELDDFSGAMRRRGLSLADTQTLGFLSSRRVNYDQLTWAWMHEMRSMGYC